MSAASVKWNASLDLHKADHDEDYVKAQTRVELESPIWWIGRIVRSRDPFGDLSGERYAIDRFINLI